MTILGAIFPPDRPPEELRAVAVAAEAAGLEQLWIWEDCFRESGIATAAAALAWTDRVTLGIGLLPVPLRNVALTAMELATLERLFPGRLVAGIGHGVAEWMQQVGALEASPMTLLREYAEALAALLAGDEVSVNGRYVTLDRVKLDWPPTTPPSLLIGGVRERTVTLAGEVTDGVILTGDTTPEMMRTASAHAATGRQLRGRSGPPDVISFITVQRDASAESVAETIAGYTDGGATHAILLGVGDRGRELPEFVEFVAREVRPLVS